LERKNVAVGLLGGFAASGDSLGRSAVTVLSPQARAPRRSDVTTVEGTRMVMLRGG
jgi:hypothetical protein